MAKKDWSLKMLLAAVAVLLGANLLVFTGVASPRPAQAAGLPDSGAQFQSMVEELKGINTRLDAMQKYLESGNLTVTAKPSEKSAK